MRFRILVSETRPSNVQLPPLVEVQSREIRHGGVSVKVIED